MDVYDRNTGKATKVIDKTKGDMATEKLDLDDDKARRAGYKGVTRFHGEVRYKWHDGTPLKIGFTYQLVVGEEMTKPMRFGDVREVGRFLGILVKAGAISRAKAATIRVKEYTKGGTGKKWDGVAEKQEL